MRAESAPAVVDEGTQGRVLLFGVVEEGVVEPEGVREPRSEFRLHPLLPVEPPEIDALALHGVQHGLKIGVGPLLLVDVERHGFALPGPSVLFGEWFVNSLIRLDARSRVEVERHFEVFGLGPFQEIRRRGEQLLLPGVASPADALSVFVLGGILLPESPGLVPVHVDDQYVDRDVDRFEFPDQVDEFVVGVLPVAAPPVAERVLRGQRRAACDELEVGECLFVVVAIGEEVEVLAVALGAGFHPLLPFRTVGRQHVPPAVVYHGPACARQESLLHRFAAQIAAVAAVERTGRAHQVLRVFQAGGPNDLFTVEPEDGFQVPIGEFTVFDVGEREGRGGDGHFRFRVADPEGRDRGFAVDERQRGAVLETSVFAPLHADQLRREHRETGVPRFDDRLGVGFGVAGCCRAQRQAQRRKKNCSSFHIFRKVSLHNRHTPQAKR